MTETVKKATTPRKPRKTAPSKKANNLTQMTASYEQVAQLAHRFWAERGGTHGNDAEDWFRAERELLGKAS
jgi:ribonuclease I